MKILLAEGDFISRKAMNQLLSQYGECDVTVDGGEAVEYCADALENKEPYDLVCLSVDLPVMDGWRVFGAIRKMENRQNIPEEKRIKVILMADRNLDEASQKAFEFDEVFLLEKPVDENEFREALDDLELS